MTVREQYRILGSSRRELTASIEEGIADGALPPGARLPSVRALAAELGLSPATVAAAYADLRARGAAISEPRRGVRVAHRPALATTMVTPPPADAVDLASGNPDPSLLPPLPPLAMPETPRLYGAPPALSALLDAVGDRLEADDVRTGHLSITSGALDGIDRVLDSHLRRGDRVVVEDPCWTGTRDLLRVRGLDATPVPVDERGLLPTRLGDALVGASALLVTPRAHNATGAAVDADRAAALRAVLAGHPDVLVVEDDHAGEVSGADYRTLTTDRRRWAVVRSVAKSLGPDLRVAVLAGDRETVARVEGRQRLGPGWVSTILQRLVVALFDDPATADLLATAATTYARRRTAAIDALRAVGIDATGRSGLNVWIPVPEEVPIVTGLLRRGWAVRAGEPFRFASGPGVRVTTAALAAPDASRLADDLAALLRDPPGGRLA